jgi:hypothetical protein
MHTNEGAIARCAGWNTFLETTASFRSLISKLADFRSGDAAYYQRVLSEVFVFIALGLRPKDMILDEEQLKRIMFFAGTRTPEGVFFWAVTGPLVQHFGAATRIRITVEVKRYPGWLAIFFRMHASIFCHRLETMLRSGTIIRHLLFGN